MPTDTGQIAHIRRALLVSTGLRPTKMSAEGYFVNDGARYMSEEFECGGCTPHYLRTVQRWVHERACPFISRPNR